MRDAAAALRGVAVRTPLLYVEALGAHLKLENLQPMGAFKIRGAYNAIRKLPEAARSHGVITYSSGNHGQAIAYAARYVGIRAVVVMPETAPAVKVAGVRRWGGEIVMAGRTSEDRQIKAEEIAAREGLAVIAPYDDPDIVAGQATVALEIVDQLPEVATVVCRWRWRAHRRSTRRAGGGAEPGHGVGGGAVRRAEALPVARGRSPRASRAHDEHRGRLDHPVGRRSPVW